MSRSTLPPIFKRVRPRLIMVGQYFKGEDRLSVMPDVILHMDAETIPTIRETVGDVAQDYMIPLTFWKAFWLELRNNIDQDGDVFSLALSNHLIFDNVDTVTSWLTIIYDNKGKQIEILNMTEVFSGHTAARDLNSLQEYAALMISRVLAHLHQTYGAAADKDVLPSPPTEWVDPPRRNDLPEVRAFQRRGDSVSFHRLKDSELRREYLPDPRGPSPAKDEPSYHMRDHAVRGYWRTSRTGRRTWIKSHRKGDPELGTITKVIEQ